MDDQAPKVFISYSHDSPDHKRWVADLASKLMENGINTILDQWELRPGDDVPKFMERNVRRCDRVLMICTESYVHKADEGKGGVGYEAMVVTGELVADLGTAKFVPLIRQDASPRVLPVSMSTRLYIDFSDDVSFEDSFDQLIRDLHSNPISKKPPLGPNPFASEKVAAKLEAITEKVLPSAEGDLPSIESIYARALLIAQQGDLVNWRKLIQATRPLVSEALVAWRSNVEPAFPSQWDDSLPLAKEGVKTYAPLIAIALAGVESGQPKFTNQRAILDDILYPNNWTRGGVTVMVDFPTTLAFVYQGLHGATCMVSSQPNVAINLISSNIEFPGLHERIPMWSNHGVMGWPQGFKGEATTGWKALTALSEEWSWLHEIFGEKDEYRAALSAYYMMMNLFEYVNMLTTRDHDKISEQNVRLEIPLCYESEAEHVKRRAYSILMSDPDALRRIWTTRGIDDATVQKHWSSWLKICSAFISGVYPYAHRFQITHRDLIADLC
ncbi:toll/interleukin-1 receptor domain-containing protein [Methylomonas koyamae]|uniref:SEFIR domain-containing protein n=1 Tax=Methylomonas koyamae TaxID=702114 RepID=A0AA91I5Y9_9GAMM|nr:toll/interleukin-1 receptor domain-containing protein [Methylomonas koyamae]OAI27730.1 hypothetical protein A1356_08495 [Methylomonas koyamae]